MDNLTKQQAEEAMDRGDKVRHQHFDDKEWMMADGRWRYKFEDGVICARDVFWSWRSQDSWLTGWSIYKEKGA